MIGDRIRLAREIVGITQFELAEALGTTQSGVASMEAGIYRPSTGYLEDIARRTGFSIGFFHKGEIPDLPFGSILYRTQTAVKKGNRTKAHAIALVTFELAGSLASRLKKIPINVPRQLDDNPENSAQITRACLGLSPNTPIRGLIRILERNGVFVFSLPMVVDGFDGFSAWAGHDPPRPVITLLRGKTAYRQVFTGAEELGHLTMHSPLRVSAVQADVEAKAFAREFLLPADAMHTEMQLPITLTSLAALKQRWGVSMSFLAKRAETLSLVSRNQHRYLIQQMRSAWGTKSEPGDDKVVPETPGLLPKMGQMLYGTPIDIRQLAKDCGLPLQILRGILGLEVDPARVLEFRRSDP